MKFYPADWIQDTRILSHETRGLWIDLLCLMWIAPQRGYLEWTQKQFEVFVGAETDPQIATDLWNELLHSGVGNFEIKGTMMCMSSRRMLMEEDQRIRAVESDRRYKEKKAREKREGNEKKREGNEKKSEVEDQRIRAVESEREESETKASGIFQKSEVRSQKSEEELRLRPPIAPHKEAAQPEGFADFWHVYPKKVGKGAAEKAWKKIRPSNGLCRTITEAVENQKEWPYWLKEDGKYIPNPATWLNQSRWEDELPEKLTGERRLTLEDVEKTDDERNEELFKGREKP